ncbi:MAG TPA: ABC transporter permease subunit/CPBP intramembrane protease [Planctomycetaceae bacterium]|nr:ABC transporter permease subunit/CPBP intramembrane protease [Planctomycetaceae bacterium]
MLNRRNVKLIFLREVKDQLRDRRTLFMVAILPLLLYPALGLGMMQLKVLFQEQPRIVVVLGADRLPAEPRLLEGHRFAPEWFSGRTDPNRLVVVSDLSDEAGRAGLPDNVNVEGLLEQARAVQEELKANPRHAGELFGSSGMQVLLVVPPGLGENLNEVQHQLETRQGRENVSADYPRPQIVYNKADEKSQITYNRVTDVLEQWEARIRDGWLRKADLDVKFTHPVLGEPVDVALDEQIAASLWGRLFPALLVIMSVTGAFYPAIDLVAGEKERGTMETLLICPATRPEIVLGKFFTVMLFSCTTALLNLASMGFTGRHIASMAPAGVLSASGGVGLPPLWAIVWIIVLLLPLAALFSALCLALATFARSSKEGQYYLTPLLMVTLGLTMFCSSPGVELNPLYSLMPVAGVALLLKGMLLSPLHAGALYPYVVPVLLSSLAYSVLALWWAIDQFKREEVLFREAERFELRLWIRHLLRDKEPTPSFSEAGFCFVLIMMLQFFCMGFLQQKLLIAAQAGEAVRSQMMMHLLLVQQLAIIASPALMMGVMLTTSVRQTFGLRRPGWGPLAVAVLLPVAMHPLAIELLARLGWLFGDLPAGAREMLAPLSDSNQPLWRVLLTFAVAPAICEEIAFRGFILRGFSRGGRVALAIGLSSLGFGIMHMVPQQVFNATLTGLVLGLLAIRSRSLFPPILYHFINNSLVVTHARMGSEWLHDSPFVTLVDGTPRYTWLTLAICLAIAIPLLRWLIQPLLSRRRAAEGRTTVSSDRIVPLATPKSAAAKGI